MKQKNPHDIIHKLSFDAKRRKRLFLGIPEENRAEVLLKLSKHIQYDLIISLSDETLVNALSHLDPDEATDIVQLLPKNRQKRIIGKFNTDLKRNIEVLNAFDPETAAGLMNLDYIQADVDDKITDVAKQFKVHEKKTGRMPTILVMSEGKMKGYLPGHELGFAKPSDSVKRHIKKISTIPHSVAHDEVIRLFRNNPHNKIAVTGDHGNVVGIIYSDDVLKILEQENSSSLYDFAGVHEEESVTDSAAIKIRYRYKWLIINLATAFLAAFTVSLFHDVISKYVLLAVYMPIVAGMGGNAATQTLAVLVRGIALKQIELKTIWPTLKREVIAGIVNGMINGLLVASVVLIFNKDVKVALILGAAMIINLFVAASFGTFVPLLMKRFGKDPATSATIFITTATDVLGFMVFLGLATLILK